MRNSSRPAEVSHGEASSTRVTRNDESGGGEAAVGVQGAGPTSADGTDPSALGNIARQEHGLRGAPPRVFQEKMEIQIAR